MRILYLSGSYIPSRRASSIQVMRMCAAMARRGHRVSLVSKLCLHRQEPGVDDDHAFYGVERNFELIKLPRPAIRGGGLRYLREISRLVERETAFDLHYCREPLAAWLVARRGLPVTVELHGPPTGRWARALHRRLMAMPALVRLVLISDALRQHLGHLGLLPDRAATVIAHDAAEAVALAEPQPLAGRPPRLGYFGHLYPGKGAATLFRLARRLPDCELHVVGGTEADLARWRHESPPSNLQLHGFVPPARLAELYGRMDVLLLPYERRVLGASGRAELSRWMSPLKLFEYLAAGRPIVASDLPVLREVLEHERNALLVPPDDLEAWQAAVRRLLDEAPLRRRLSASARREHRAHHTWEARAEKVLAGLGTGADGAARKRPAALCIVRPTMGQGGADRVTLTLLRELDRRLFRPHLVLMRAAGELLAEVPADVPIHTLGDHRLWTAWWPLARHLRRLAPDVLLSTSSGANLVAALARRLSGRRMRLVLSERNVLYRDQGWKRWPQARLKRLLYPQADCLTAVSEGVRRDLVQRLELPPEDVRVVFNPVVTPAIAALAAEAVPHPWLSGETPVILAAGRLVPAKGFDILLRAFARLPAGQSARLMVLGEGPERASLERLAAELGVSDEVVFAGFDPNPFRYMSRCAVFVLSSRWEGLPGVLIQAMACGAPVVATDCSSGPAEIIEDGVEGFLVPVDDPRAMSARIEAVLGEPRLAARLARAARRSAQRFSAETAIAAYTAILLDEPHDDAPHG